MKNVVLVDPLGSGESYVNRLLNENIEFSVVFTDPVCDAFATSQRRVLAKVSPDQVFHVPSEVCQWDFLAPLLPVVGPDTYVVCGSEPGIEVADQLRIIGGVVPRNDDSLQLARLDKYAAQIELKERGLHAIDSCEISSSDQVNTIAKRLDWPVVVKPVRSAGSDGVEQIYSEMELQDYAARIFSQRSVLGKHHSAFLIQETVQGCEYVVDGYVFGDTKRIASVGVYRKQWVHGIPMYKSLTWLPFDEVPRSAELYDYVANCLDALGVRVGCFHFEVFDTEGNWKMVEVGLRPHGGGHPRYTSEFVNGCSQLDMEVHTIVSGLVVEPSTEFRALRVVFLDVETEGTIARDPQEVLTQYQEIVDLHLETTLGERVKPPRTLLDTFGIGFVVIQASTESELEQLEDAIREVFRGCIDTS